MADASGRSPSSAAERLALAVVERYGLHTRLNPENRELLDLAREVLAETSPASPVSPR